MTNQELLDELALSMRRRRDELRECMKDVRLGEFSRHVQESLDRANEVAQWANVVEHWLDPEVP